MNGNNIPNKVTVKFEMDQDGLIQTFSSTSDLALVILILEKAKMKLLNSITISSSPIVKPRL